VTCAWDSTSQSSEAPVSTAPIATTYGADSRRISPPDASDTIIIRIDAGST
jgi:hypothetical protein